MKNKFLKKINIVIICLFLFIVFLGCNLIRSSKDTQTNNNDLKGSINIWCLKESQDIINYGIKSFSKSNPKITAKVTAMDLETMKKKLEEIDTAHGSMPDIIEVKESELEYFTDQYKDKLTDLKGSLGDIKSKLAQSKLDEASFDSKLYAVPWNVRPLAVIYNKKLADQYKINPFDIKTWDQYLQAAETVQKQSSGNVKMIALKETRDDSIFQQLLVQQNINFFNSKGEIDLASDKIVNSLNIVKKLYDTKAVYSMKGNENIYNVMNTNKVFSAIVDGETVSTIVKNVSTNKGKWQLEAFPAFEPGGRNSVCGDGSMFIMPSKTAINDAALGFIKYMVSDRELSIYELREKGIIPAYTDFYYVPYTNSVMESFNEEKVWRFLAESALQCSSVKYGSEYDYLYGKVLEGEQRVISKGEDPKTVLSAIQEELKGGYTN